MRFPDLKHRRLPPFTRHGSAGITARARIQAEREMLGRYRAEYEALAGDLGHPGAVQELVGKRWTEYEGIYRSVLRALRS